MKLLLVEDDRVVRITVRDALLGAGFEVQECADGLSALRTIEHELFDIVLTDVRLPGLTGFELFSRLRQYQPGASVVLMTAWASADDAVRVMKEGARDYITKPFELDELVLRLGRVRQEIEHHRHLEAASGGPGPRARHQIKGRSQATGRLLSLMDSAAASDVSVLVTGETGTGKDLCARTIHERSARAGRPFVAVNCAAIPETLLESELFGHLKGAFTGATGRRLGRFEAANGGTLFLDEIGELPLAQQAKVLRAIDARTIEPVGSNTSVPIDVRLIAATNLDLEQAIAEKRFRRDLFYRLNVIELALPALRERRDDIPELVADFLSTISVRLRKPAPEVEPATLAALCAHDYPGNVRELVHAIEHAVALARDGVIRPEHLPRAFSSANPAPSDESLSSIVGHFERQYILQVLNKVGGHRGNAADLLGISRKALWQKLKDELPQE